jgi:hypothetical protein
VALALRGSRNMDHGIEEVTDAVIRAQVQKQARGVRIKAAFTALALTAVTLLF